MKIRESKESDALAIDQLYGEMGYGGEWSPSDEIFLVEKEFQRQGIGTSLLREVENLIINKDTYCVPYQHLSKFYGQIGFKEVGDFQTPEFLLNRKAAYVENELKVIVMKKTIVSNDFIV